MPATVIADQKHRRAVHAALRIGRYRGWDFNPSRDASEEYTRCHSVLIRFDITSCLPRRARLQPKVKVSAPSTVIPDRVRPTLRRGPTILSHNAPSFLDSTTLSSNLAVNR